MKRPPERGEDELEGPNILQFLSDSTIHRVGCWDWTGVSTGMLNEPLELSFIWCRENKETDHTEVPVPRVTRTQRQPLPADVRGVSKKKKEKRT